MDGTSGRGGAEDTGCGLLGVRGPEVPSPVDPCPHSPRPPTQSVLGGQDRLRVRVTALEEEVHSLRKINRDLFDFSTHIITRPAK